MKDRNGDFERRLCRIDGMKPNARDRWKAFHRLWRLSNGHGGFQDIDAGICFRVLFGNWRAVQLLDGGGNRTGGPVGRKGMPLFLRKQSLEMDRKKRVYNGHSEWKERDKVVAHKVRDDHGIEVTPDEVAEVRRKVINLARRKAAELDFTLPPDDDDVLKLFKPR